VQAQTAAAAKAAQAAAQQAGTPVGAAQRLTVDGQTVALTVQDTRSGQGRPAQAAGPRGAEAGRAETPPAAAPAKAEAAGKAGGPAAETDPTARALKDALAGERTGSAGRRGEDAADPRAQRADARPAAPRAAGGGMSPALRAAAEAVQQQLGGNGAASAQGASTAGQPGTPAAAPAARAEAAGVPQPAAGAQTFDPVLQNAGPQPGGTGQPGALAAAGKAAPAAGTGTGTPAPAAPPAEQVAVQIQRAAAQGQSRVQIRLNPAELGRIDVKLDVGDDGHVRAVLSVDKSETLDLMQRDPRALERALQAAGLKTDQASLSFNLREDGAGQGQRDPGGEHGGPDGRPGRLAAEPAGDAPLSAESLRAGLPADGRVDIRV
jgi:flagellar hook-length control protein FliK